MIDFTITLAHIYISQIKRFVTNIESQQLV